MNIGDNFINPGKKQIIDINNLNATFYGFVGQVNEPVRTFGF
ncbi:hypothetical protein [uncultured Draconibacterium sp.]|nr:hypothetical protein [uncultured Draconibacterium sp.]